MRQNHIYKLKITIEGEHGHGKTLSANEIRAALTSMGACVTVSDGGEDHADNGEFRHFMPDTYPRCAEYPLAQTMVYLTTKYPK